MKQKGFAPIIILVLIVLGVLGYFVYQNYLAPKGSALGPYTPLKSSNYNISTNESEKLSTYNNSKFNFLFKYPNNWKFTEKVDESYIPRNGEGFSFDIDPGGTSLDVAVLDLNRPDARYKSLDDFAKEDSGGRGDMVTNITIDGLQGKSYYQPEDPGSVTPSTTIYLFNKSKNYILVFRFVDPTMGHDNTFKKEFDQLLSTFKFLDKTSPAPTK